MTKTYIHYGNKKFDKNLFKIPKNNSQLNNPMEDYGHLT